VGVVLVPPIPRLYAGVQPHSMSERIARSLCRSQATALRTADFKQWPGISSKA